MKWTQRTWVGSTVTLALVALFLTGCPKQPEVVEPAAKPMAPQGAPAPKVAAPEEKSPTEVEAELPEVQPSEAGATPEAKITEAEVKPEAGIQASELKDIYFDFDQSAIRDDSRTPLNGNVEWFRKNPAAKVAIEGHCDERGSSEYNLALGERRARATRDYLVAAGVAANRISTISFGKERPFTLGHDESAWKWNRRAHFVLSAK